MTFLYGAIGRINREMPVSVVSGLFRNAGGPQAGDLARLATIPTLLVVGAEDRIFPVPVIEAAHRLIPGSRLEIVPGAAHSTHFEQAAVFNRLLAEFMAGARHCRLRHCRLNRKSRGEWLFAPARQVVRPPGRPV